MPTAADAVIFNVNSGAGTVTADGTATCVSFTGTGSTLTLNGGVSVVGNVTIGVGMTLTTGAASWILSGTGVQTITANGVTFGNSIVITAGAGSYTLQDAFTTTATITLTSGTLNTNSKAVTAGILNLTSASTKVLTLGSSPISLTGGSGSLGSSSVSGLTFTANTAVVTFTTSGATVVSLSAALDFNGSSLVFAPTSLNTNVNINANGSTFNNVTFTTPAGSKTTNFAFAGNIVISGAWTITGDATYRTLVNSSVLGTARTVTANGTIAATRADFQDITAAGTASWNLSAATGLSGDALGNTGITFTTPATQFWVSGTGNWSDSTKWKTTSGGAVAGRVPLPQDSAIFDQNSFTVGAQIVSVDVPRACNNMTWTGVLNAPTMSITISSVNPSWYGDITFAAGMAVRGTFQANIQVQGRSAQTFTSGGWANGGVIINTPTGTYTFQDAYTGDATAVFNVTAGTLASNNQTVTSGKFSSLGSVTRAVTMGTGAWSLTAISGVAWNTASSALTLTVTGNTTSFTGTSGTPTITTGGVTMPAVSFNGLGGSWTLTDAFTSGGSGTITVLAGTFSTGNQSVTTAASVNVGSGTATRALSLGTSAVALTGASTVWSGSASTTGLTLTATSSTITASGSTSQFASSGQSFGTVIFSGVGTPALSSGGSNTFVNLTRTGTAVKGDGFGFAGNATITGTLTLTGNSTTNRLLISSGIVGSTKTLTCTGATFAVSNTDFQDTAVSGATLTGTSLGDALGNSGITFDAPTTVYGRAAGNWSATATWSATVGGAGGTGRVPLPQDTVVLDASSPAGTYSIDMPRSGADITCTGFARTLSIGTNTVNFGSLTLASGMTFTNAFAWQFAGRGSHTITNAGKTFPGSVQFSSSVGGTYTQQDAFLGSGQIAFSDGTYNANNQTFTTTRIIAASGRTAAVTMGTGAWTLNASGGVDTWHTSTSNFTLTVTGASVSFTGTSGTNTITTGGVVMPNLTFNGVGGTWQFQDAVTASGLTITLTNGTLDTNGKAVSAGVFSSTNSNTRVLTLGATALTLTGGAGAWDTTTSTGMTLTANTSTITFSGAGASMRPSTLTTYNTLVFSGSGNPGMSGSCTCANLTRTGTAVKTDTFFISTAVTINGTAALQGNSATNRLLVQSGTIGTAATITLGASATCRTGGTQNVDFMDITLAGGAVNERDLTAITGLSGDGQGNTGITFTAPLTLFNKGGGASPDTTSAWSATSGGVSGARVPLPQDTARFDANTTGSNSTFKMPRIGTMDFTGYTAGASWSNSVTFTIFGNLVLAPSMSIASWNSSQTFGGRGAQTITTSGNSVGWAFIISAPGGTYTLADAFSTINTGNCAVNDGTLDTASKTVSTWGMTVSNDSRARGLTLGTTAWTLTATTLTAAWNFTTTAGLTFSGASSSITLGAASSNARTFIGGGLTYGTLTYTIAGSPGALVVTGANTFTSLTVTSEAGNAKTLTLPVSTITTVTTALTLAGVSGSLLVLNSSTGSTAATLAVTNPSTITYVSVQDITGSGVIDVLDGVNVSGNTGISFMPPNWPQFDNAPNLQTLVRSVPLNRASRW